MLYHLYQSFSYLTFPQPPMKYGQLSVDCKMSIPTRNFHQRRAGRGEAAFTDRLIALRSVPKSHCRLNERPKPDALLPDETVVIAI